MDFSLQGSGKTLAFGIPILQYILNNSSVVHDTTEHARKLSTAKAKKGKQSKGDKPLKGRRHKKESEREENVIDLNEVLHHVETSKTAGTSETDETSDTESEDIEHEVDTSKEERFNQPFLDKMEMEDQSSSLSSDSELEEYSGEPGLPQELTATAASAAEGSSRGSKGKAKMNTGLVGFKDNIPDEEFQRMIAGELDPWETDGEKAKSRDDKKKHSSETNKSGQRVCLESHDIKDGSHDSGRGGGLVALILAPTRELAIQVHDHLTAVAKHTDIKVHVHVTHYS